MVRKVVRRRRALRRKPIKKRVMRKRRGGARKSDYARLTTTIETPITALNDATGESLGQALSFCLQDYQRPQEVAHAFKYYRASKVEVSFLPYYNISQTNGAPASRLPQLYMTVDRVANMRILPTESEMLSRGVSAKLWNRKMKLMFKPNLLQIIDLESNQPADGTGKGLGIDVLGALNSIPMFNKWVPTQQSYGYTAPAGPNAQINQQIVPKAINPYALQYYGFAFVPSIEGLGAGVPTACGDLQIKITWEFKEPRALVQNKPLPELNPYQATSMTVPGVVANTQPTDYGH